MRPIFARGIVVSSIYATWLCAKAGCNDRRGGIDASLRWGDSDGDVRESPPKSPATKCPILEDDSRHWDDRMLDADVVIFLEPQQKGEGHTGVADTNDNSCDNWKGIFVVL